MRWPFRIPFQPQWEGNSKQDNNEIGECNYQIKKSDNGSNRGSQECYLTHRKPFQGLKTEGFYYLFWKFVIEILC